MARGLGEQQPRSAAGLWTAFDHWFERRALSIRASLLLLALLLVAGAATVHLFALLTERSREIRQELLQRDLRDLVGRFDADERFVIERNLEPLLTEVRDIQPLLLPRQYYAALPVADNGYVPRQPPRNCFVKLATRTNGITGDRFCAYFSEKKAPGRFLFLNLRIQDDDVVVLKPGDSRLKADGIRLTLSVNGHSSTWLLVFQSPANKGLIGRYEVGAFRQSSSGQLERDRKLEGWAYQQTQSGSAQYLYVIARLDFKQFSVEDEDMWPPSNWRETRFELERRSASKFGEQVNTIPYANTGAGELSLSELGSSIFSSYGTLSVDSGSMEWQIQPPTAMQEKIQSGRFPIKFSNGDILIAAKPEARTEPLADTSLTISAAQPWWFIERGFWKIEIYLIALFLGGVMALLFFRKQLLDPIDEWSRQSAQIANAGSAAINVNLPYGERKNEIGILARAINTLTELVRNQVIREQFEKYQRVEWEGQKREDEIRNRTQNMMVIAHEIRAPLQALLALHPQTSDRSRRHLERMNAALPHLLGGGSTVEAIQSRPIRPRPVDVARFLTETAANAGGIKHQLAYDGPSEGILCNVDDGALEDILDKLLDNAFRHSVIGSQVTLTLTVANDRASIDVDNSGDEIPPATATRIFEIGISTVERTNESGQGLGLYIARDYARRMGGDLIHLTRDEGTIFRVLLPLMKQ